MNRSAPTNLLQRVGIVTWLSCLEIADAKSFVREALPNRANMFACADRNFQITLILEMIISIQERMPNQRCPYYCRQSLGNVKATRLIIEMIAPARAS